MNAGQHERNGAASGLGEALALAWVGASYPCTRPRGAAALAATPTARASANTRGRSTDSKRLRLMSEPFGTGGRNGLWQTSG